MIKININISIEELCDLIIEYVSSEELHYTYSVYQLLTEYPNEVANMAKQFNVSRDFMMEIIFDYDDQITKQLTRGMK